MEKITKHYINVMTLPLVGTMIGQ